jgi:hypothetical protein
MHGKIRSTLDVPRQQTGTVLVVALVMLAALSLMATASVQTAVLGLRIAGNTEDTANAFQTAQSAVDFALVDTNRLPMTGQLHTPTPVELTGTPFDNEENAGSALVAMAERTADCGSPPRLASGSSLLTYSTFSFRIAADLDRTHSGRGRAAIRQGYLVLGPKC